LPAVGADLRSTSRWKGEVMTEVTPPIKVSGVPLNSRASRRIRPSAGGPAERLGNRMRRIHPLLVSWIVANVGAVLLAVLMIGLGFFVTKVLLSSGAIAEADAWLPRWMEDQRTPFLNDASYIASMISDRPVLIPLVGLVVFSFVLRKRWRLGSYFLQAILAEVLVYGLVTRFIERPRPEPVEQLDKFNLLHSYPSGHVAASVAVYGSLGLLLAAHFKDIRARVAIWTVAAGFPLIVASSRIYRGEHHPIDVAAGALMGIGAICVALFAARTARRVAELRHVKHAEQRAAEAAASAPVEAPADVPA
jgi:membrane-associated phospholipid phosphatase